MNARIVVLNAGRNIGAFLPGITPIPTASSNGVCGVIGAPGTMPVPAPRPAAIPPLSTNPHAARLQPSACAPTAIRPSIYISTPWCGIPPVYRGGNSVNPVPALKPNLVVRPGQGMKPPTRLGGRRVTRAVRPIVRWPQYGGGYA
jgi:hypothetical protein